MANKTFYYVAVETGYGTRLVTSLDYSTKTAKWEKDAKPMKMTRDTAKDIQFGLCMNLTPAYVVQSLFEIDYQWRTGGENDDK